MVDPLGGPVGIPLIGPVTSYSRPTDPLAPIRDMMAKMALVAAPAAGPRKGDAGPDPLGKKPEPGPLVPQGFLGGLLAGGMQVQHLHVNLGPSRGSRSTRHSNHAGGNVLPHALHNVESALGAPLVRGASLPVNGIPDQPLWFADEPPSPPSNGEQMHPPQGGGLDLSGDPAFDTEAQRKERNKLFPDWRDHPRPPTQAEIDAAYERRKIRLAREEWVREGHSEITCGTQEVEGAVDTKAFYPVLIEFDRFMELMSDYLNKNRPSQTQEHVGEALSEFLSPADIAAGVAVGAWFGGPAGIAFHLAFSAAVGLLGLSLEHRAHSEQERAVRKAWVDFVDAMNKEVCAFICGQESIQYWKQHADACWEQFCYKEGRRASRGYCFRDETKCTGCTPSWPFEEDKGLKNGCTFGEGRVSDKWPRNLFRGWSRYRVAWKGRCECK